MKRANRASPPQVLLPSTVSAPAPILDLSDLGEIECLPSIPEPLLRRHRAYIAADTRFRAAARLLQALWREDRELPIGIHLDGEGKPHKLGSSISAAAGVAGANFIHPAIARLVRRELIYREHGAVYEETRLLTNLLSSQPLVFNLFGPLKLDLKVATAVFNEIAPNFIKEVTAIVFEHSPGRGDRRFSADGTAFDALIRGVGPMGERRFIAIEVKFSESGHEPPPRFSGRFDEIAPTSGLFIDAQDPALWCNPNQQLFRQICLAHTMLEQDLYDQGLHLLIAPAHNAPAQNIARSFVQHLSYPDGGRMPFINVTLERFVEAINEAGSAAHARALHRRYCDWWLIDGELEMEDTTGCDDAGFTSHAVIVNSSPSKSEIDEQIEPRTDTAA